MAYRAYWGMESVANQKKCAPQGRIFSYLSIPLLFGAFDSVAISIPPVEHRTEVLGQFGV